jgi:hypothetical protein
MPDDQTHPAQTAGQPAPQAEPPDAFDSWWDSPATQKRIHCGHFNERDIAEIAYAAAQAGAVQPAAPHNLSSVEQKALGRALAGSVRFVDDLGAVQPAADALTDTERLNWLEAQWREGVHVEVCAIGGPTWHGLKPASTAYVGGRQRTDETLRGAIDAIRGAAPKAAE